MNTSTTLNLKTYCKFSNL